MSHTSSRSKRCLLFLYVVAWSLVLVAAGGWLTLYLVGTLDGSHAQEKLPVENSKTFDSLVALTEKKVVRYLGEWELLEPKLAGHFHHVGRWYASDASSFCIDCHGPIPHGRNPKERAFLNMHNLFISCQVCHVHEQPGVSPTRFGWLDITTGRLCPNPEMTPDAWGEYGAKIVPLQGSADDPQPLDLPEEKAFAAEFRQRMDSLNASQKAIGNKFIHKRCVEEPVRCSRCHNSKGALLPYTTLGYSAKRAAFLISAEVVDLVQRYETFHMPKMLDPQDREGENAPEESP